MLNSVSSLSNLYAFYTKTLLFQTNLFEDRSEVNKSRRSLAMQLEIYAFRLFINALIIIWLSGSLYLIYVVVLKQMRVSKITIA